MTHTPNFTVLFRLLDAGTRVPGAICKRIKFLTQQSYRSARDAWLYGLT